MVYGAVNTSRAGLIAVPVFDRPGALTHCLRTLAKARGLENWTVVAFDDASQLLTPQQISELAPFAIKTIRADKRRGADGNVAAILRYAGENRFDRVFILDSDMIVASDALARIDAYHEASDGILSLYNSRMHETLGPASQGLVAKKEIGWGGCVFSGELALELCNGPLKDGGNDWDASRYLTQTGRRLLATERSYVQHLGLYGQFNPRFGLLDYGAGFRPDHPDQFQALVQYLDTLMLEQQALTGAVRWTNNEKPRSAAARIKREWLRLLGRWPPK